MQKAGMEIREDWIVHVPALSYSQAFSYILNILKERDHPDGIFAVSDMYAVAALHAIKKAGFRVPEDISVIGFDNSEISSMVDPPITTIAQPSFQIGYQSCELLIEKINTPNVAKKQLLLNTELIIRNSTANPVGFTVPSLRTEPQSRFRKR
jgi:DNA-binding LacI/PurR family transcriptional regulator